MGTGAEIAMIAAMAGSMGMEQGNEANAAQDRKDEEREHDTFVEDVSQRRALNDAAYMKGLASMISQFGGKAGMTGMGGAGSPFDFGSFFSGGDPRLGTTRRVPVYNPIMDSPDAIMVNEKKLMDQQAYGQKQFDDQRAKDAEEKARKEEEEKAKTKDVKVDY